MKGLLYKDLVVVAKTCRTYLLVLVVFLGVSLVAEENAFSTFYPCLRAGMIPLTILSYDERSRWMEYSGTLPCTRAQLVSVKYLLGVLMVLAAFVPCTAALVVRQGMSGGVFWESFFPLSAAMLCMGLIVPAICLPLVFRLGVEKGRIVYLFMTALVCAFAVGLSGVVGRPRLPSVSGGSVPLLAVAGAAALYVISWRISVAVYQKREL